MPKIDAICEEITLNVKNRFSKCIKKKKCIQHEHKIYKKKTNFNQTADIHVHIYMGFDLNFMFDDCFEQTNQ